MKWGNKYFINEVYEIPKVSLGTGLYRKDIQLLILDLLAQNGGSQHVSLTIKKLLKELEMVNYNYVKGYNNYIKLSELLKVDEDTIGDIFYLIYDKTTRNLKNALNDLADKALIIWKMSLYVCCKKSILDYNEFGKMKLDNSGKPIVLSTYDDYRQATDEQEEFILKVEKSVMNEMRVRNKIFFNINDEAREKFRKRCNEKLKENDIRFYYYQYDITYNSDEVLKELGRSQRAEVRDRLNQNILTQVETTIENISNNTKEKIGDDAMDFLELELYSGDELRLTPRQQIRVKDSYVKDGKKTAKVVIDRKIKGRNKIKWDLNHENFNEEYLKAN